MAVPPHPITERIALTVFPQVRPLQLSRPPEGVRTTLLAASSGHSHCRQYRGLARRCRRSRSAPQASGRRRQLSGHCFSDQDRAVAAVARHLRQGVRQGDGRIFRRAREHCSGPVHRGDAAGHVSGNDRPGNPVAELPTPSGRCSCREARANPSGWRVEGTGPERELLKRERQAARNEVIYERNVGRDSASRGNCRGA